MERIPKPEANCITQWSDQFEVLVYGRATRACAYESWQCQLLPPLCGDSHICISVKAVGTYCLDTASHTWSKFALVWLHRGPALAAADLSSMDSQPQLVGSWNEIYFPEEWEECKGPQLVNLGSGRFCIARFFHDRTLNPNAGAHLDHNVVVFTGVELVLHSSCGKVELQMIYCKSLAHMSNVTAIDAVF
ncbi:hypothetical protein U9M48_015680 [Paspalum notatum var. saurae]|uniref:Uncharacterized protein n=1 Tax=Paspalum notatum var. saurae TaxID=547442 RepID=A0AAQ3T4D6_PASNO